RPSCCSMATAVDHWTWGASTGRLPCTPAPPSSAPRSPSRASSGDIGRSVAPRAAVSSPHQWPPPPSSLQHLIPQGLHDPLCASLHLVVRGLVLLVSLHGVVLQLHHLRVVHRPIDRGEVPGDVLREVIVVHQEDRLGHDLVGVAWAGRSAPDPS